MDNETIFERRARYIKITIILISALVISYFLGYCVARGYNVFMVQKIIYPPQKIGPANFSESGFGNVVYIYITGVCYKQEIVDNETRYVSQGLCREWVMSGKFSRYYYASSPDYPLGSVVLIAVYSTLTADLITQYIAPLIFIALALGLAGIAKYRFIAILSIIQFIGSFIGVKTGIQGILDKMYPFIIVKVHILVLEATFLPIVGVVIHLIYKRVLRG